MTSRERVLRAVARQEPDRVPLSIRLTSFLIQRLRTERGVEDPDDFLRVDLRSAPYHAEPEDIDFSAYTARYPDDAGVSNWGVGQRPVGYFHFSQRINPMRGFTEAREVAEYPFPAREPVVEDIRREVEAIQGRGLAAVSAYESGTFEQAHALMGMEELLVNMHLNPEMVRVLFNRIAEVKARIAAAYVEAGVDILFIGDDIGIQRRPVMDPAMWREFLIPPLKRIVAAARGVRRDVPIAYHSCGYVGFAVEGLIEAGIDILESVQPEANDPTELKARYGDRLAFWGGVGSQSTMSRGTPEDVAAEVKHRIETVGRGGGYICAPAHAVEPESPLENIDAFLAAIEDYGYYR